jgi:hypothetical protein
MKGYYVYGYSNLLTFLGNTLCMIHSPFRPMNLANEPTLLLGPWKCKFVDTTVGAVASQV